MKGYRIGRKNDAETLGEELGVKVKTIIRSRGKTYIITDDKTDVKGKLKKLYGSRKIVDDDSPPEKRNKTGKIREQDKYRHVSETEKLKENKHALKHYAQVQSYVEYRRGKRRKVDDKKLRAEKSARQLEVKAHIEKEALLSAIQRKRKQPQEPLSM